MSTGRRFEEVLSLCQEIGPLLDREAQAGVEAAKITPTAWQAIIDARLHLFQNSPSLGGDGFDNVESMKIFEELSRADGSVGWIMHAVTQNNACLSAFLPDAGVEKLFGDSSIPTAVAGMPAPRGNVTKRAKGGYVFEGKWGFASGATYCTHFYAGGHLVDENDEQVFADDGTPVLMVGVVPRDEVRELGNWNVHGMQSTDSIDYELDPTFVSEESTFCLLPAPTELIRKSGLPYQMGLEVIATAGETAVVLGLARRALEEIAYVAARKSRKLLSTTIGGAGIADQPHFKHELAMHYAELEMARTAFYKAIEDGEATLCGTTILTDRIHIDRIKVVARRVYDTGMACVRFAHDWGGSSSLRVGGVIGRVFNDCYAANLHASIDRNHSIDAASTILEMLIASGEVYR